MSQLRLLVVGLLVALTYPGRAGAQAPATPGSTTPRPSLVVIVVVDQMRADYLAAMRDRWTDGLARLTRDGAVLEQTFYPYLQTVTCAGHATVGTGAFPSTHGIIANAWWRGTRSAPCTEDPTVSPVAYEPGGDRDGHSAVQLLVPTLGDRLRAHDPDSRVVALSVKPRSAIMLAGKGGLVTWLDERNVWATSTAYVDGRYSPVSRYLAEHPRSALRGEVWERTAARTTYTGEDGAIGEGPPRGWTSTFPHPLAGAPGTAEREFTALWENSPYADEALGDLAATLVRDLRLGRNGHTDYLGVSFAALDAVGHKFGPDSHEVQDTLLRLDRTLGQLLRVLDEAVGPGGYVLGLTADHGVAPIPESRALAGLEGGRIEKRAVLDTVTSALAPALGPGRHALRMDGAQVYLSAEAQARVEANPALLEPAMRAVSAMTGVDRVLPAAGLERQRESPDPVVRAAALSHVTGRSGQLVVITKPYYIASDPNPDATTHGTHQAYDQHVPMIFFGAGVKAGRYRDAASPADLAPTLADRIGLPMPGTDGRPLRQVFLP
jgi:predicted AlkP superfamily pyrophosphatase or phosphodiesterase